MARSTSPSGRFAWPPPRFLADLPHRHGGQGEKLFAILKRLLPGAHQFHERLVDQGGGLQRVSLGLATPVADGDAVQFVVYQRHQLLQGVLVPFGPSQ
jgi:hypothetical protein